MFLRKSYINQIKTIISKENLLVILWPRQAGKTSLLYLLKEDVNIQKKFTKIVYFNFEDIFGKKEFINKQDFYDFIKTNTGADMQDKKTLIMLDEVQEVKNAQWLLKSLYDDKKYQATIIATWSGMRQLSSGWSSLVGRGGELTVYPFSFKEFVESKWLIFPTKIEISQSLQEQFANLWKEFCTRWWYPAVIFANSQEDKITELGKILTRLVEKDIAFWLNKQELPAFEKVLQYVVRNAWNLLKYEAISQEIGISKKNIESYIYFLNKSQILYNVYPFFKDKTKELTTHPKLYLWDIWLMTFLTKNYDLANDGRAIENNTFLEILKNKKHIHDEIKIYRKLNNSEIDFLYQYVSGEILPIEIKSGNETTIPKIFYSFDEEYPKTKTYIKTTNNISTKKKLWDTDKNIIFSPNRNISNCL